MIHITRQRVRAYQRRMDKARGNQQLWDETLEGFQRANRLSKYSAEMIATRGWEYVKAQTTK